jgi:methanogenic corrinoid protein MtbC1
MNEKYTALINAIHEGDIEAGVSSVELLLQEGSSPVEIFTECIEPSLNHMGIAFSKMEIFLPELIVAADVVNAIQELVKPILAESGEAGISKGKGVIATVQGDLHDIGKNMVSLMMQVNGFEMYDLGVDASPMNLVAKAEEVNADLLCLSGLMMPSMPFMRETIELAKANPVLKDHIKIMVGGGPVTEQWAGDNGADGYADDAMGAVKKAYELLAI